MPNRREILAAAALLAGCGRGPAEAQEPKMPSGPLITRKGARVPCYVIPTNEELVIARQTQSVLGAASARLAS